MIPRKTYDQTKRGSPHERLQHAVEEVERDAYEAGFREALGLAYQVVNFAGLKPAAKVRAEEFLREQIAKVNDRFGLEIK